MDLLTTISACSVAKDFTLVFAMVISFSNGNVFTVKDAAEIENPPLYDPLEFASESDDQESQLPRTRADAIAKLTRVRASGGTPVVGLLPVPPGWAANFNRKPPELLEACVNISIGSAMVAQFEYECGRGSLRECVLKRYAQAAGIEGFDEDVLEAIRTYGYPEGDAVVLETDNVFSNPILAPSTNSREWGADKIFFTTQPESRGARVGPRDGASAEHVNE